MNTAHLGVCQLYAPTNKSGHEALRKDIAEAFDGYTMFDAMGAWYDTDDDALVCEPMTVYSVAIPWKDDGFGRKLILYLARQYVLGVMGEKCAYIVWPDGVPQFLDT
jgi:hypothetical protein